MNRLRLLALAVFLIALVATASAHAGLPAQRGFNDHSFSKYLWTACPLQDPTGTGAFAVAAAEAARAEITATQGMERDAGANIERVDVDWAAIEPSRGVTDTCELNRLDTIVNNAGALGIKPLLVVLGTPCWASSTPSNCAWEDMPADPADYGRFVATLTNHYGSKLAGIEVYNEVNAPLVNFSAAQYASLVEAAYAQRTNGVPIVAGALVESSDGDLTYMDQLFTQPGFSTSFDVWSVHAYDTDAGAIATRVQRRRDKLTQDGSNAPIWVDEFGWSTCSNTSLGCVTPAQQGSRLAQTFKALGDTSSLNVTAALSYDFLDDGADPANAENNFGIVDQTYAPKRSYATVAACLNSGVCS